MTAGLGTTRERTKPRRYDRQENLHRESDGSPEIVTGGGAGAVVPMAKEEELVFV